MKVKRMLISIIVCILMLLGSQVYAALDATVTVEGAEKAKKGETISVVLKVKLNSVGEGLKSILGDIEYPEEDLTMMTSDEVIVMDGMMMIDLEEEVKSGEKEIEIEFLVKTEEKKEATIKFIDVILTDVDETDKEIGTLEKKIKLNENEEEEDEKTLESIEITETPDKVEYKEGEVFDTEGMEVTAKYSDGSTKVVTEYEISPNKELTKEDTKITISYTEDGKTVKATQEITVEEKTTGGEDENEKKLAQIKITKTPKKVDYKEGEKFSPEGMEVTATYSDGSTKVITGYKYSPNGALKTTDTKIIVSYTEDGITKEAKEIAIKVTKAEGGSGTGTGTGTGSGTGYPAAGLKTVIIPAIVVAVLAIVGYVGNKKYKNI